MLSADNLRVNQLLQQNPFARILAEHLHARTFGREAFVHDSMPSTQDAARRLAADGAPHGMLIWALEQTAGRGRLDRAWLSPAGAGLWFSLILRPPVRPDQVAFLSIVAGVGVAEGLRTSTTIDVRLKWPNDLLVADRKLGGILAEAAVAGDTVNWVVLGVGINLQPLPGEAPHDVRAHATSLAEVTGARLDPAELLAQILMSTEQRFDEYIERGPAGVRSRWVELSDTIGRKVRADLDGRQVEGEAIDLGPDGSLLLRAPDGSTMPVASGEVIHLR
jgi:BirA family biotin operon repressor/biotin-[acetyl-CoA-carboxylase] ligase